MLLDDWIRRYATAWESGDAEAAVSLFTAGAAYQSSVFREPHVGRDAIYAYWSEATGTQSNVVVKTGRPIRNEDRTAVEWWTTMTDGAQGEITLPGCLLLRFDRAGLCSELWEYWQVGRGKRLPPAGWGI